MLATFCFSSRFMQQSCAVSVATADSILQTHDRYDTTFDSGNRAFFIAEVSPFSYRHYARILRLFSLNIRFLRLLRPSLLICSFLRSFRTTSSVHALISAFGEVSVYFSTTSFSIFVI